jgi:hypothetical protein
MPIRVDAYTVEGIASGTVERPGSLRDTLETSKELVLTDASWQAMGAPSAPVPAGMTLAIDDVLLVTSNDDPFIAMHAAWHAIRLEMGPYLLTGELPTLPGFDPGRALTRPSGEFVMLRDVKLAFLEMPDEAIEVPHVLVNRYGVDRVDADLMLGFFFPGAIMDSPEAAPEPHPAGESTAAAATSPTPVA